MESQRIGGRYQVLRAIGRGGMGTVWLCRDDVLGRQVAVKQIGGLPGEPEVETARAMREARAAAALNHPNAVAAYDVVDHDGRPYLVMEYVEGRTLGEIVTADGPLPSRQVADVGAHLAAALALAHERGIVHRDVKVGNVLVDGSGRPKISDFGIARHVGDDQLTQTGLVSGTPAYLSPELARGADPNPASDVWALGATLYVAAEGRPPYAPRENSLALLSDISTTPPLPMSRASAPLAAVIESMMQRDPAARPDMRTVATRLAAVAAGADEPTADATRVLPALGAGAGGVAGAAGAATRPAAAPAAAPAARPARPSLRETGPARGGRSGALVAVVAVLVLLLALAAVYALTQSGGSSGTPPAATSSPAKATSKATSKTTSSSSSSSSTTKSSPSSTSSSSTTAAPPASDAAVAQFVRSYFHDVTRDRDRTWQELTPKMQAAAGGRSGYEAFWSGIASVRVGDLEADAEEGRADATLTYTRTDGTTSTERHRLDIVRQGDRYLIDGDHRR